MRFERFEEMSIVSNNYLLEEEKQMSDEGKGKSVEAYDEE